MAQIWLARWLGPVAFGSYSIGWNVLRVGSSILPFGFDIAALQIGTGLSGKRSRGLPSLVATVLFSTGVIAIGSGIVLFVFAEWLAGLYAKPGLSDVFRLMAIGLPLAIWLRVGANVTRISLRMRFGVITEELLQPLSNLVLIAVLVGASGLLGALWAAVISLAIGVAYLVAIIRRLYFVEHTAWKIDQALIRKLWGAALPISIAGVFSTLILLTDRFFVGIFRSEAETGIFQAASLFSSFFVTVLSAFKTIVAPLVSRAFQRGDSATLRETFANSTRWGIYLSIPVAALLIVAAGPVLQTVYGTEYSVGANVLILLTLAQVANVVSGPVEYFLIMTENSTYWVRITSVVLLVNVLLNIWLVPTYGSLGAATATLTSFTLLSLLSLLAVHSRLGITPYDGKYWKGLVAGICVVGLYMFSFATLNSLSLLQLTALALAGLIIFSIVLWLLRFDPADLAMLRQLLPPKGRDA